MKRTKKLLSGTSFHGSTVLASRNELISILSWPHHMDPDPNEKVQYEWFLETSDGDVFTIYDWKEYRDVDEDDLIKWHIGGFDGNATEQGRHEVSMALIVSKRDGDDKTEMKMNYITILDFEVAKVFQYKYQGRDNNDCVQMFLGCKGHNLTNCQWMLHSDGTRYGTIWE